MPFNHRGQTKNAEGGIIVVVGAPSCLDSDNLFAILRVGEKIHEKYFPPNLQGDGKKYRIFLKVSSPALTILFGRTGSV